MQQPMLCLLRLHKRVGARLCARARTRSWRSAISSTAVLGEAYVQVTPCCHHWKATGIARSSKYKNEETPSYAAWQRQVCGHRGRRLCSQNMVNPRDPRSAGGGISRGQRTTVVTTDHIYYSKQWLCGNGDEGVQFHLPWPGKGANLSAYPNQRGQQC
jgi:hypothetical protein